MFPSEFNDDEYQLARIISSQWVAFAKSGVPDSRWPLYSTTTDPTFILNTSLLADSPVIESFKQVCESDITSLCERPLVILVLMSILLWAESLSAISGTCCSRRACQGGMSITLRRNRCAAASSTSTCCASSRTVGYCVESRAPCSSSSRWWRTGSLADSVARALALPLMPQPTSPRARRHLHHPPPLPPRNLAQHQRPKLPRSSERIRSSRLIWRIKKMMKKL